MDDAMTLAELPSLIGLYGSVGGALPDVVMSDIVVTIAIAIGG